MASPTVVLVKPRARYASSYFLVFFLLVILGICSCTSRCTSSHKLLNALLVCTAACIILLHLALPGGVARSAFFQQNWVTF